MLTSSALPDQTQEQLRQLRHADIVVGIPSYNNATTIAYVIETAARGLATYFPDLKAAIVCSDGGSRDGTREVVLATPTQSDVAKIAFQYQGLPGKGSAFRAVFEAAERLEALACIVLDSDLRSVTPEWINLLGGPVIREGFGYVAPYYRRYKYDGTITNNIAYPLTRALYGVDVRQPIGGDFGMSGELVRSYLQKDVWSSDVAKFGIDIWMTTTAINENFRLAQAQLGVKIHDAKDPAASLGPMFVQVVGTLFGLMAFYGDRWLAGPEVRQTAFFGTSEESEPEPVEVSVRAMIDKFKEGARTLDQRWREILTPSTQERVAEAVALDYPGFRFPTGDWIRVVYDFAIASKERPADRASIVQQMAPLYYARTAGFVTETEAMSSREAEEVILAQAQAFVADKEYLISRWNGRNASA